MGDTAEGIFDLIHPKSHQLGLNRPPFYMGKMTPEMRYTPDRMTSEGIYEVMGIGRDSTLKLKYEKIVALRAWTHIGPLFLFVYDQTGHAWYEAPWESWVSAVDAFGVAGTFPEGKDYYALHKRDFPCDPVKIEVN